MAPGKGGFDPMTFESSEQRLARVAGRVVFVDHVYLGDYQGYWVTRVWNPATLEVEPGPSFDSGVFEAVAPVVDGPAWVAAFYAIARAEERQAQIRKARAEREARDAAIEAATPSRGKTVKVVRGRKVAKGTVGRVFWYGEGQWGWSVGLELNDGTRVFTAARNVEVQS